mgnify:CR=1 FL=1|jgi:hypothetical protein
MIEIIVEFIGGWLMSGSDKGWQGKSRTFILYAIILGFAALGIYLYIINFSEMRTVKAAVYGFAIMLFYSLFGFIYWAVNRQDFKSQNSEGE